MDAKLNSRPSNFLNATSSLAYNYFMHGAEKSNVIVLLNSFFGSHNLSPESLFPDSKVK